MPVVNMKYMSILISALLCVSVSNAAEFREFESAVRKGDIVKINDMLNAGIDIDQTRGLATAIHAKKPHILRLLLTNGANPDQGYTKGVAVYLAAKHKDEVYFNILLEYHADLNIEDPKDTSIISTPLIKSIYQNKYVAVNRLLNHGADPNKISRMGNTALHQALLMQNVKFVNLLLQHRANPNVKNRTGVTAKRYAKLINVDSISKLFGFDQHTSNEQYTYMEYPNDLDSLNRAYIANLLGLKKSSIRELNKNQSLSLFTSGNRRNKVTTNDCRYIKGFAGMTRKIPGIKVMLCAGGMYSPSNIDETIENQVASNKIYFGSMKKVSNNYRKLLGVDKLLVDNNKVFVFVQIFAGHGMAIIPTAVIVDEVSQTSLIVQLYGEDVMKNILIAGKIDMSIQNIAITIFNHIK